MEINQNKITKDLESLDNFPNIDKSMFDFLKDYKQLEFHYEPFDYKANVPFIERITMTEWKITDDNLE